ncbi:CPBP family intramembrane metalloprotease [Myxococcota bacterium]|nr:CPBP family intramembrane metalloprotease [Myxococcota bacterium]
MVDLSLSAADAEVLALLLVVTIAYVAYHHAAHATQLERHLDRAAGPEATQARAVILQKLAGAVLLGVVPAIVALAFGRGPAELGLVPASLGRTLIAALALAVIALPAVVKTARRPESWAHYPQITAKTWTRRLERSSALAWAIYLVGYELCFRGVLLFPLVVLLGPWPAIAISTLAYTFAHLPKNAAECVGCIPMGVIFAVAALWSGSIWAVFLAHLAIAVTSEQVAIRANPAITRTR